jgi:UPF0716 protein FxsA
MLVRIISLFVILPLVELYLLLKVGSLIGAGPTVGIVIFTGIAGGLMARRQGFTVWRRIQEDLNRGMLPTAPLVDGLFVLAGGLLLLTPGLITDAAGFLVLLPPVRNMLKRWIRMRFQRHIDDRAVSAEYHIEQ